MLLSSTYRALQNLKVIVFSCKGYNTDIARDILDWWPRREELEGLYREHQKVEEQNKETSKKGKQPSAKRKKPTAKKKAGTTLDPHTPRKKPRLVSPARGQGPDKTGPSSSRTEVSTPSRRTPSQRRQKTPPWVRQGYGPPIDNDDDDSDFGVDSDDSDGGSPTSSSESDEDGGGAGSGDEATGSESDEDEDAGSDREEDGPLDPARHPLMRAGAMPKMSKAAMDMAVGMVVDDLVGGHEVEQDGEEDELDD